jgi:hypothetical protein
MKGDIAMAYEKRTIVLTKGQRNYLEQFINKGIRPVQELKRARILFESDAALGRPPSESVIAERVGVTLIPA